MKKITVRWHIGKKIKEMNRKEIEEKTIKGIGDITGRELTDTILEGTIEEEERRGKIVGTTFKKLMEMQGDRRSVLKDEIEREQEYMRVI